jgi:hypothetical protein
MKRSILSVMVAFGLVAASATATEAQLTNFPVYAVPSMNGTPASFLSVDYGRGLNDWSGKQNAFGLAYGRTGIADRVGIVIGAGMVNYDPDAKYTFGGSVGFDLLEPGSDVQIGVQGGLGYISLADEVSNLNLPIGVAVKGTEGESLSWWFMPRLNYMRASAFGITGSSTDFGASAGGSINTSSGFGIHVAVDLLAASENIWQGGVGVHYIIG